MINPSENFELSSIYNQNFNLSTSLLSLSFGFDVGQSAIEKGIYATKKVLEGKFDEIISNRQRVVDTIDPSLFCTKELAAFLLQFPNLTLCLVIRSWKGCSESQRIQVLFQGICDGGRQLMHLEASFWRQKVRRIQCIEVMQFLLGFRISCLTINIPIKNAL